MPTVLSVKGLEKTYPNGVRALKKVSFEVKKGEFLVVIGLSGSGKSTLLKCLNHLQEPTGGKIEFNDEDITYLDPKSVRRIRTKMGFIFQHFNLINRHTVLSNVLMGKLATTDNLKSIFNFFPQKAKDEAENF